jgi:hypothetical protein
MTHFVCGDSVKEDTSSACVKFEGKKLVLSYTS